jgi:uncharacterized Fe-S cluster-containing radical SAM superfamily protein
MQKIDKAIIEQSYNLLAKEFETIQPPPELAERPQGALIEITNACNLNCVMCNTKNSKRSLGFMKPETFETILQQLKSVGINSIGLHTVGETFMFPELEAFLSKIQAMDFSVWLSTNGQFPQQIKSLTERFPNLANSYRFSIDGAKKETYESIRKGGKYEKILESLEIINFFNQGKINSNVFLSIDSILSLTNIDELPLFFKTFSKYCLPEDIKFWPVNSLSPDQSYFRSSFPFKNLVYQSIPCLRMFNNLFFTHDGRATLCCRDYEAELVVGDIMTTSLMDIWQGKEAEQIRAKHLGPPEKMDIKACSSCYVPFETVSYVINEFIHRLYIEMPALKAEDFGKKVFELLKNLDYSFGNKDMDMAKEHINAAFDF